MPAVAGCAFYVIGGAIITFVWAELTNCCPGNRQCTSYFGNVGVTNKGGPRMDDLDEQRKIRHGGKPALQIALMRDVMPIVALIAALAAMFWQVQG
jgi:hypothetical protein